LAPFAPHAAEELWEKIGEKSVLSYTAWPKFDPTHVKDDTVTLAIQVMGKTRGTVEVEPGANQETVEKLAREIASVKQQLEGKSVKKVIFVPNKILNFVVG
jgi:leucyl-tRNA synthetase